MKRHSSVDRILDRLNPQIEANELLLSPSLGRATGRIRTIAFLLLAFIAAVLPSLENRAVVVGVLAAAAVLETATYLTVRSKHLDFIRQFVDRGVILLCVLAVPELWIAGLVAIMSYIVWEFMFVATRLSRTANSLTVSVVLAVGMVTEQRGAVPAGVVTVVVIVVFSDLGRLIQDRIRVGRNDLGHALLASGTMVHLSSISTGRTEHVVGPVEAITGWTADEWTTIQHRDLLHPDDVADFWIDSDTMELGRTMSRKGRFRTKDGGWVWLQDVSRLVVENDEWFLRGFTTDVTKLEEANRQVRRQAETDGLTKLSNRTVLTTDIERRLASNEAFMLAVLDLNRFKEINDTLGHEYGDQVLVATAARLRELTRPEDTVARLGGDEFAIVVDGIDSPKAASAFADRLTEHCGRPIDLADVSAVCAPSIGMAVNRPDQELTVGGLLHWADVAMYKAKGENISACLFSPEIEQTLETNRLRRAGIGGALERDEFLLHFQPKVNMVTGAIYGVEGLARWNHPKEGLLLPKDFIDLIISSRQASDFSDRVIAEGIRFAAQCNRQGTPVSVAINIPARSLVDEGLANRTSNLAHTFGVDPRQLTFEITEQDIMEELTDCSPVLTALSRLGVALSVDDFGTGYSSLARLIDLPVSEVKIDRRFVQAAPSSAADRIAVQSILDLAGNLGMEATAEGVGSEPEARLLLEMGCVNAQGYLFGRPAPAATVLERLSTTFASA